MIRYKYPIGIYEVVRTTDEIGGYTERLALQHSIFCSINNKANSYKNLADQNTDTNIFNITVRLNEYSFTLNTIIKFLTGTLQNKMFKVVGITPFDMYGYIDLRLQSIEPNYTIEPAATETTTPTTPTVEPAEPAEQNGE